MATKLTRDEYEVLLKSELPEDKAFLELARKRGMIPDLTRGRGAASEIDYKAVFGDYIEESENKNEIKIEIGALMEQKAPMSALTASYWALDTNPSNVAEELGYKCSVSFIQAVAPADADSKMKKEFNNFKNYFKPILTLSILTDKDKTERAEKRAAKKRKEEEKKRREETKKAVSKEKEPEEKNEDPSEEVEKEAANK